MKKTNTSSEIGKVGSKRKLYVIAAIALTVVLFMAASWLIFFGFSKVKASVTVEAGAKVIAVGDFLKRDVREASFVTDISSINLSVPGAYKIEIQVDGRNYISDLVVTDTIVPKATSVDRDISESASLRPDDFVTDIIDATTVTARFANEPPFGQAGEHVVAIILTDLGGNQTMLSASLRISNIKASVAVEIGGTAPDASAFLQDPALTATLLTDLSQLDLDVIAEYPVEIECGGRTYQSSLTVVDTTAPAAAAVAVTAWLGEEPAAAAFVKDIADKTAVVAGFAIQPDFSDEGTQDIKILLTDAAGNSTTVTSTLTLIRDTEAPKIIGSRDRTIYVGETISYKSGVTVTDNKDSEIKLVIENSKVNLGVPGEYPVTYSATDAAGNTTAIDHVVIVLQKTAQQEEVYKMADLILAEITTDGMSKRDIAWAIYQWSYNNIEYVGSADSSSAVAGAYEAFKYKKGDCFTYYAASEILLTRAGIDNMRVTRLGGNSRHYWNLVNIGEGWYHFDSSWRRTGDEFVCFMKTDAEVAAYTVDYTARFPSHPNYYTFDPSLYPKSGE